MHVDKLVTMANRIGQFFSAMPDREEALDGIAQHIRRFWEPRMRHALLDGLDAANGADIGLEPIVLQAINQYRPLLESSRIEPEHEPVGGDAG